MGGGVQGSKEERFLTIFIYLKEGFPKIEEAEVTGEAEPIGGSLVAQSFTLKGGVVEIEDLCFPDEKQRSAHLSCPVSLPLQTPCSLRRLMKPPFHFLIM